MNERSMASFRRTYERSLSKKDQRPRFISRQQLERVASATICRYWFIARNKRIQTVNGADTTCGPFDIREMRTLPRTGLFDLFRCFRCSWRHFSSINTFVKRYSDFITRKQRKFGFVWNILSFWYNLKSRSVHDIKGCSCFLSLASQQ